MATSNHIQFPRLMHHYQVGHIVCKRKKTKRKLRLLPSSGCRMPDAVRYVSATPSACRC